MSEGRKIADSAPPMSTRQMRPPAGASIENLRQVFDYVRGLVSREHVLSLADQAVVSATSFLTTLLIARWSGPSQLGIYALGLSVLLSLQGFQESLIVQPYQIQRFRPEGSTVESAGASLTLSILFSAASIFVLIVAGLGFLVAGAASELVYMTWAIAAIVPFALVRDFVRRFAFAHFDMVAVFLLDLAAAIIQLSALGWLGARGQMSALSACAALGGACAFPTAIWLCYSRAKFTISVRYARMAVKQTWELGKWLLLGRISVQLQGYVTYWISIVIGGAAVTGVYAACMSIVGFANPLMIGVTNVLMPKLVLAWKDGGGPGLWKESNRSAVQIAVLTLTFSLAIFVGGEQVMRILYQGKEFEGLGQTLTVLALAMSVGALGMPASIALATMERPRAIVTVTMVAAVLTIALVSTLMTKWGLLGAAYGMLAGSIAGAVGRWVAFFVRVPKSCDSTPVTRALEEFTKCVDNNCWTIRRIGGSGDTEVFVINSTRGQPIWGTYDTVVAKVYKPGAPFTFEIVQAQINSLDKLRTALDGREFNGWTIAVPRPLYSCKSPLALMMTVVPGRQIDSCTSKDDVMTSTILIDAARAFAMAMEQYWSSGRRHGDLNFRNVLFDIESKGISVIDAGSRQDCRICNDSTILQSAAATDLGHLVWELGIDIMDTIKSQTVRMRKELFVETVLLTIIDGRNSGEQKRQFLNEIWNCAQQHIAELPLPWSLQGVWNRILRQVARQRIRLILDRVYSHPNIVPTN